METINKTYSFTPEQALGQALFYKYTQKVVDETLLDENGNVPMVEAMNEDGTPKYEMDVVYEEMTPENPMPAVLSETVKLDEAENPIPVMEPLDVYIDNPETPVQYLSRNFDEFVKPWFTAPVKEQLRSAQKEAERAGFIEMDKQLKALEESVLGSITTVIS